MGMEFVLMKKNANVKLWIASDLRAKIRNPLLLGTFFLTGAGLISRFLGFFYRIWLSGTIGEFEMGMYQLIFPVFGVTFAFCATAIQTSISRFTAMALAKKDHHLGLMFLKTGLACSLILSLLCCILLCREADVIAASVLRVPECERFLPYIALMLPLGSVHACIGGYYLGCRNAVVPAASQLAEQFVRIFVSYAAFCLFVSQKREPDAMIAIAGMTAGEAASFLLGMVAIVLTVRGLKKSVSDLSLKGTKKEYSFCFRELSSMACPLTFNRVLTGLLQSGEAILLPLMLRKYGMSAEQALSEYGVFSGMALPFILFPSAITNSMSAMLLPLVADAAGTGNKKGLRRTVRKVLYLSGGIGAGCFLVFLFFGKSIGSIVYHSETAGAYLMILSWLCPFLYINSSLASTLNGLGCTGILFLQNTLSLIIRVWGVVFLVPSFGMRGYLWGLLASTILVTLLHGHSVRKHMR